MKCLAQKFPTRSHLLLIHQLLRKLSMERDLRLAARQEHILRRQAAQLLLTLATNIPNPLIQGLRFSELERLAVTGDDESLALRLVTARTVEMV